MVLSVKYVFLPQFVGENFNASKMEKTAILIELLWIFTVLWPNVARNVGLLPAKWKRRRHPIRFHVIVAEHISLTPALPPPFRLLRSLVEVRERSQSNSTNRDDVERRRKQRPHPYFTSCILGSHSSALPLRRNDCQKYFAAGNKLILADSLP